MEDMPYMNMAQAPYPPPVEPSVNKIASMALEMLEAQKEYPSLTAFVYYREQSILGALPKAFHTRQHPYYGSM